MMIAIVIIASCRKQELASDDSTPISSTTLEKIKSKGFSTYGVQKFNNGYIVEGDIFLTEKSLNDVANSTLLSIGKTEQYRTNNRVTGLPRVITVSVTNLSQTFIDATDIAISRYNGLNLRITFQRVSSGGNINIIGFYKGPNADNTITLGSAGFPDSNGNPYNEIQLNTYYYNNFFDVNLLASTIQHEIGHTIGLRHTDYTTRGSCPYANQGDEGQTDDGAIHIPGTPYNTDTESLMLACSNGTDRSFNPNDIYAFEYLYGIPRNITGEVSSDQSGSTGVYFYNSANNDLVYSFGFGGSGPFAQNTILPNGLYNIKVEHFGSKPSFSLQLGSSQSINNIVGSTTINNVNIQNAIHIKIF